MLGNAVGDGVVYVHKRIAALERNILFYILAVNFQLVTHNLIVENELYSCKDTKVRANKFPATVKKIQDDYLLYLSLFDYLCRPLQIKNTFNVMTKRVR